MESLISDKNAMDPEIVMPGDNGGTHPATFAQELSLGLPRTWALAVFMVVGTAVVLWGAPTCLVGLAAVALIASFRGSSISGHRTGAGAWLIILHHAASLAALACGVHSTLQFMAGNTLHTWLSEHIAHINEIFPTAILLFITLLFILGLERSRLLRHILMGGMPTILMFMVMGCILYHNPTLLQELYQTTLKLSQVLKCTAFFTLIFSGAMDKKTVGTKLSVTSFVSVITIVLSCVVAVVFLTVITERGNLYSGVLLINALEYNNEEVLGIKAREVWVAKGGLAAMAIPTLSLSLVEVLHVGQRSVVNVANHILPGQVARDNLFTGTQLLAILMTGVVSSVLVWLNSVPMLLMLSSASYLLSHSCNLVSTLYLQFQPSFVPRQSAEDVEGGGSYQLLSDTTRLVESDDSESELSDDSGHSSDTDIDAVVHEYKETVKVITQQIVPVPTVNTARHASYSLLALVFISLVVGGSIMFQHRFLPVIGIMELVLFICIITRQPQTDLAPPLAPWQPCITLCLNMILLAPLLLQIWASILVWSCLGLILWLYNKQRRWFNLQAHLCNRKEKVILNTLPHHYSALSFLPSYRKLAFVDTTHVIQ